MVPLRGRGEREELFARTQCGPRRGTGIILSEQLIRVPSRPPAHPHISSKPIYLPEGRWTQAPDQALTGEGPSWTRWTRPGPAGCFNYQSLCLLSLRSPVSTTETCQAPTLRTGQISYLLALVFN